MSAGSPRVTIRIPEALLEEIQKEMASHEYHSARSPEDVTRFILRAIEERIDHKRRSRAHRRDTIPHDDEGWPLLRYRLVDTDS